MTDKELCEFFGRSKNYFYVIKKNNPKKYNMIKDNPQKYVSDVLSDIKKLCDIFYRIQGSRLKFGNLLVKHGIIKNKNYVYAWFSKFFRVLDEKDVIRLRIEQIEGLRKAIEVSDEL